MQINENVNHIAQILDSRPVYLTRAQAQRALLQNKQGSDSDNESSPLVRSVKKSTSKEPVVEKPLNSTPLIPPNISMEKLSSINTPPPLIPKPLDLPNNQSIINEPTLNPLREETNVPLKPPLETPTFYRAPRKIVKETISPAKKRKHNSCLL